MLKVIEILSFLYESESKTIVDATLIHPKLTALISKQYAFGECPLVNTKIEFVFSFTEKKWHQMRENYLLVDSVLTPMNNLLNKFFLNMDRYLKVKKKPNVLFLIYIVGSLEQIKTGFSVLRLQASVYPCKNTCFCGDICSRVLWKYALNISSLPYSCCCKR